MKTSKLSKIFDFLFGTTFIFLICLIWFRFFIHNIALTLLLCSVVTFCICSLYYLVSKNNKHKKQLSDNELKQALNCSTYFLLSTKKENLNTFGELLKTKYKVEIKSDYIIVNNNILRPLYCMETITDKEVLESYAKIKNGGYEKLIIACKSCSPVALKIAEIIKDIKVIIQTEYSTYQNILKPLNFVCPKLEENKSNKTKKLNFYLSIMFNKRQTKGYLITAVVLLFGGFVLRYNIYYIIFSTLSCLLALYSHFNKKFNVKQEPYSF